MRLENILDLKDELNLYLTVHKLKRASYLNPNLRNNPSKAKSIITLIKNSTELKELEDVFTACDLEYQLDVKKTPNSNYVLEYLVATNENYLNKLIIAKNDVELGLALGYPREDVQSFRQLVNGERRIWSTDLVAFARAKKRGIKIPSWIAYISFIPKILDLVNNKISESAMRVGKRYQNFVRENNPELGERIEEYFHNHWLPQSWLKLPNGEYYFKYQRQKK